jgi:hypothetical protein
MCGKRKNWQFIKLVPSSTKQYMDI